MIRRGFLISFILLVSAISPAFAEPAEELALRSKTAAAFGAYFSDGHEAATAVCESARALITPSSPKYLMFHIERCLAQFAEKAYSANGGVDGGKRCPHYQRGIAIMTATPPPVDMNDEEGTLTRARFLRSMKDDFAAYCGPNPPGKTSRNRNAMVIPATPGASLQTQEGIAYALPDGFGVGLFDPGDGGAILRNVATGVDFGVTRKRQDTRSEPYPERETLSTGRILEYEYAPFLPGSKTYSLFGRVAVPGGFVMLGMSALAVPTGVEKAAGLAAFRTVANSVRITGPRKCLGECGAGALIPGN